MRLFVFIVGYFYGSSWATGNPKTPDESENENFDTSLTISDALGSSLTTKFQLQDENFFDTSVTNVDALGTSMTKSVPGIKVMRTCIKAWMSLNLGQIPPLTMELAALERLRNRRHHFVSVAIDPILFKLADIQLSGFYIMGENITDFDITLLSSTCSANTTNALLTLDDIAAVKGSKAVMPSMCDDTDDCIGNPCGSNVCIDKLGGYECICTGGYSGSKCQIPPDFCSESACQHGGQCVNSIDNYACVCPYGFHGMFCESKAADGQWSQWSQWSGCSHSCGGGISFRSRRCDSPPPDPEGKPCNGSSNETVTCNVVACPECPRLRRSFGEALKCNETEGLKRCSLTCRPGLYLTSPALLSYECGELTNYKWNHQTPLNPTGRLPRCTYVKPPEQFVVKISGEYLIFPCDAKNATDLSSTLLADLRNVTCAKYGNCSVTLASEPCRNNTRSKRSSSESPITVEVTMDIDSTLYGQEELERFLLHRIVSRGLFSLFEQLRLFNDSVEEMFQQFEEFSGLYLNEQLPHSSTEVFKRTVSVVCPAGSVQLDAFCAEVPAGSYVINDQSWFCPTGTYQDEPGSTICKACPKGTTTIGVGAESALECTSADVHHEV